MQKGKTMRTFDYSFLKTEFLSPKVLKYISNIEISREQNILVREKYPKEFTQLENQAKINSVKHSNAIEGIVTTDDRVASIVGKHSEPQNHTEKEISGYRDSLDLIHNRYKEVTMDEVSIKELHALMLGPALMPHAGEYKDEDNIISEKRENGTIGVRFRPISADETPAAMEQLMLAYQEANQDADINKLLLIPCFILDFLCIHPFEDGNGRMSRLLTLVLLYKNGYTVGKYISIEEQINQDRENYYESLRKSSEKWHDNKNEYQPFIEFYLKTISTCYYELNQKFKLEKGKKIKKNERIREVVLKSIVPISKKKICEQLPDVSMTTVEAVLGQMLKDGEIEKVGKGKSTEYVRK